MKQILVELDDRSAQDLERVAPARKRMRAEFVRLAIRRAINLALDRATEEAYRQQPMGGDAAADRLGWDEHNALARTSRSRTGRGPRKARGRRGPTKSVPA